MYLKVIIGTNTEKENISVYEGSSITWHRVYSAPVAGEIGEVMDLDYGDEVLQFDILPSNLCIHVETGFKKDSGGTTVGRSNPTNAVFLMNDHGQTVEKIL